MKKKIAASLLGNWNGMNKALMAMAEKDVVQLLADEQSGGNRLTYLLRIQARLNVLRRQRERATLAKGAK